MTTNQDKINCNECGDYVLAEDLCWLPATFQTVMLTGGGPTMWGGNGSIVLTGPIWVDVCSRCAKDTK